MKFMAYKIPIYGSDPIHKFDDNFFTGPGNQKALIKFRRLGVKVIVSVFPKNHPWFSQYEELAKRQGINVIFPNKNTDSFAQTNDVAKKVAKEALNISKKQKVAVVCNMGVFSGINVGNEYVRLRMKQIYAKRRKIKLNKLRVLKLKNTKNKLRRRK